MRWAGLAVEAASRMSAPSRPSQPQDSRARRPSGSLTWQQEGGPGGDVDLLQMLQRLRVKEADGGAGGEGHPDAAARLHHVCHTHGHVLVCLEALLRHRGRAVRAGRGRPAKPLGARLTRLCLNPSQREETSEARQCSTAGKHFNNWRGESWCVVSADSRGVNTSNTAHLKLPT